MWWGTVRVRILLSFLVIALAAMFLYACNTQQPKSQNVQTSSVISQISHSTEAEPNYNASLKDQAKIYNSTPSRVALAMLICKLDNSYFYTDIVTLDAKELFDILRDSAVDNNITLESLNTRYGLLDILAAENIYITISSNNVTFTSPPEVASEKAAEKKHSTDSSKSDAWIEKFQTAITSN